MQRSINASGMKVVLSAIVLRNYVVKCLSVGF